MQTNLSECRKIKQTIIQHNTFFMNKTGLLIMLLALLGNSMQAQNKLYGTVENNGKPLPYVTVRLLETDSTFVSGVTTDTLGKYVFSNIEKGNYLVALSSIGYKPAFIQIKMSDKNLKSSSCHTGNRKRCTRRSCDKRQFIYT